MFKIVRHFSCDKTPFICEYLAAGVIKQPLASGAPAERNAIAACRTTSHGALHPSDGGSAGCNNLTYNTIIQMALEYSMEPFRPRSPVRGAISRAV